MSYPINISIGSVSKTNIPRYSRWRTTPRPDKRIFRITICTPWLKSNILFTLIPSVLFVRRKPLRLMFPTCPGIFQCAAKLLMMLVWITQGILNNNNIWYVVIWFLDIMLSYDIVQYFLPWETCHRHNHTSNAMPRNPAIQIPPESLTVVAAKENSRSAAGTRSAISAKVFTYTKPPSNPSQKMMRKTRYTFGMKLNRACSVRIARFAICKNEGK